MSVGLDQFNSAIGADKDPFEDQSDNRSSSLSELGDGPDEQDEPTPQAHSSAVFDDNDSEAETERLENTPRKLLRMATETTMASDNIVERTPSKLANALLLDRDESGPPSPLAMVVYTAAGEIADRDTDMNSVSQHLSAAAGSEAGSLADSSGRKRKRSSPDAGSVDELRLEEPARKRSGTTRSETLNSNQMSMVDAAEQADMDEDGDINDEPASRPTEQELDFEETAMEAAEEVVNDITVAATLTKSKRGKRKGKKVEESNDTNSDLVASAEGPESGEMAEGENDDEYGNALDEERKCMKLCNIGQLRLGIIGFATNPFLLQWPRKRLQSSRCRRLRRSSRSLEKSRPASYLSV